MKLFQKFLFKSFAYTSTGISIILTLIIWLVQLLRFSRMIAYQGLTSHGLIEICMGLLPRIILVTMPIGFLCALLWRYYRLMQDNERNIMSACGVSSWFFAWPCVAWAMCLTAGLYGLSLYLAPLSAGMSKKREYIVRHYLDPSFITPGVFFQVGHKTFYVHRQKSRYLFEGIFIYDDKEYNKQDIITGQYAYITPKGGGLEISIHRGTYQQIAPHKPPSILTFQDYTLSFNPKEIPVRKKHVHELSLKELNHPPETQKTFYVKERHRRLLLPLLPLIDALWASWILLYSHGRFWPSAAVIAGTCGLHLLIFLSLYSMPIALGALGGVLGLWGYNWIKEHAY